MKLTAAVLLTTGALASAVGANHKVILPTTVLGDLPGVACILSICRLMRSGWDSPRKQCRDGQNSHSERARFRYSAKTNGGVLQAAFSRCQRRVEMSGSLESRIVGLGRWSRLVRRGGGVASLLEDPDSGPLAKDAGVTGSGTRHGHAPHGRSVVWQHRSLPSQAGLQQ